MKHTTAKICALALAAALAIQAQPANVFADETTAAGTTPVTATVTYTAQAAGAFLNAPQTVTVSSDLAESYGYTDSVDEATAVSMLDVLVKATEDIFGADDVTNELAISDSGWLTNMFGCGSACGYRHNTVSAYSLEAVADGDVLEYYCYSDTSYYSDRYVYLEQNGAAVQKVSVEAGSALNLTAAYEGYDSSWNVVLNAFEGVQAGTIDPATGAMTALDAVSDASGALSVTFDEAGTYLLTVTSDEYDIFLPYLQVNVTEKAAPTEAPSESPEETDAADTVKDPWKVLEDTQTLTAAETTPTYGSEWAILGLVRSGYTLSDEFRQAYYQDIVDALKENDGVLSDTRYTEYSRVTIALTALGYDASDVGGYDLTEKLAETDKVTSQGVNGVIYALIALDTADYEAPEGVREMYVQNILDAELENGGWTWSGDADPDMTSMALQALAPYVSSNADVKAAADRAVALLSSMQNDDGTYSSWGTANSCSTAQVVTALTSLGIDPASDARFVKNGKSALDGLLSYAVEGGGFGYTDDSAVDSYSNLQCLYAMAAYKRYASGQTTLYDMSDVKKTGEQETTEAETTKASETTAQETTAQETTAAADAGKGTSPATGDNMTAVLLILLAVSAAGMTAAAAMRRKQG